MLPIPAISIALSAHNAERFLVEQLDSFVRQTWAAQEIVVVDDCSKDSTARILKEYAGKLPLKIHRNEKNLGFVKSFEKAFSLCTGEIIFPSDHDDIWHPQKLEECAGALANAPDLLVAFCNADLIDEQGGRLPRTFWEEISFSPAEQKEFREGRGHKVLLRKGLAAGNSLAIRRQLIQAALPIPEGWIHDEWIMALGAFSGPILPIDRPLLSYRQHASQAIGVAHSGVWTKIQSRLKRSKKRGWDNFEADLKKWNSLSERLKASQDQSKTPDLDRKIAFQESCAAYPRSRILRMPYVLGALLKGDYDEFGNGWSTALRDGLC